MLLATHDYNITVEWELEVNMTFAWNTILASSIQFHASAYKAFSTEGFGKLFHSLRRNFFHTKALFPNLQRIKRTIQKTQRKRVEVHK